MSNYLILVIIFSMLHLHNYIILYPPVEGQKLEHVMSTFTIHSDHSVSSYCLGTCFLFLSINLYKTVYTTFKITFLPLISAFLQLLVYHVPTPLHVYYSNTQVYPVLDTHEIAYCTSIQVFIYNGFKTLQTYMCTVTECKI